MSSFGPGIYSSDIALDIRKTISSLFKLPFNSEQIYDIIYKEFSYIFEDESDEDHTTIVLVLAEQFHKKGLTNPKILSKALEIIQNGKDLELHKDLGCDQAFLKKRETVLLKLQSLLTSELIPKKRTTLSKAQDYVFNVGDVLVYPIDKRGSTINPYFKSHNIDIFGYCLSIIMARDLAFGYLAHYSVATYQEIFKNKEMFALKEYLQSEHWKYQNTQTCSKSHFKKMKIEIIKTLKIEFEDNLIDSNSGAIKDISIANELGINLFLHNYENKKLPAYKLLD